MAQPRASVYSYQVRPLERSGSRPILPSPRHLACGVRSDHAVTCGVGGGQLRCGATGARRTLSPPFSDTSQQVKAEEEITAIETRLQNVGNYIYRTTPEEMKELSADESKIETLFQHVMKNSITNFLQYMEEYLKDTGIQCYIQAGNDDPPEIVKLLDESELVINSEEKVVGITEHHEMISTGHSNITPWHCP